MPKRILDGEGLWRSDKLLEVRPAWIKPEFANLLPLALANGTFEANPRRIWSTVYGYNRPEITVAQVEEILAEFERVKLLFRWTDQETGKIWAYWMGIEKPGRLPAPSRLRQGHEILGPEPPAELLRSFVSKSGLDGKPSASQTVAYGSIGFGSGIGLGSCSGGGKPLASQETDQTNSSTEKVSGFNSTEVARAICSENGWSGERMIWAFKDAVEFQATQMPDASLEQVGEWLAQAYLNRRRAKGDFAGGPQKFFEQALYRDYSSGSASKKINAGADNPATRALAQMEGD